MNVQIEITRRSLLTSAILIMLIVIICGIMTLLIISDPAVKYSHVLAKAATVIQNYYPGPLDSKMTIASGRRAMTDELDPFSGYVEREQLVQFMEDLSGGYQGIGIMVIPHDLGLLILNVREGSPAANTGVLPGDIIIASDSVELAGKTPAEAVQLIKGRENSILSAAIFRPATQDTIMFEIMRKRIEFLHIPFAGYTPDSMVYIRLLDFNAGAAGDFKSALDSLVPKRVKNTGGIIIDVRGNPGGLFTEARAIAELFMKKGEFIVGTSSRSKWNEENWSAKKDGEYSGLPLAVLIDNGSASAAEILAGTLKYSGHAVLVGDTTFGKGLVQGFVHLPEGDGLRLTISRYFFEGGRYINPLDAVADTHGVGLWPDIDYQFAEKDPFYLQLEWQLVLLRFAHINQDEIIFSVNDNEAKKRWIEKLKEYARQNEFDFKSGLTKSAEALIDDAESQALKKLAERVVAAAKLQDQKLFDKHGDFLWMRLQQIAYERKYGAYKAYKEIVVPQYEPIKIAAAALAKKDSQ